MFWTDVVSPESITVDLAAGTAEVRVDTLHMKDYFEFSNAVIGGGPRPVPGDVSYVVRWTATGTATAVDNPTQQLRGSVREATAQMEWSASTPDFLFQSAPLATSTTDAALLTEESTGSFY